MWADAEHLGDTLASDPTGTTVWNCSLVTAKYLEWATLSAAAAAAAATSEDAAGGGAGGVGVGSRHGEASCAGKRVLELGAGLGVAGLAACRLGASSVVFSDKEKTTLDLLGLNVVCHCREGRAAGSAEQSVDVTSYDWLKKSGPARRLKSAGPFDIVVASDLVYAASAQLIPALINALLTVAGWGAPGGGDCLMLVALELRPDAAEER